MLGARPVQSFCMLISVGIAFGTLYQEPSRSHQESAARIQNPPRIRGGCPMSMHAGQKCSRRRLGSLLLPGPQAGHIVHHTCGSWYAYAAMFGIDATQVVVLGC